MTILFSLTGLVMFLPALISIAPLLQRCICWGKQTGLVCFRADAATYCSALWCASRWRDETVHKALHETVTEHKSSFAQPLTLHSAFVISLLSDSNNCRRANGP
jgi:hypothetical protein